jgi:hypothetical protein
VDIPVSTLSQAAMGLPEGLFNDAMERVAALGALIEQRRTGRLTEAQYIAAKARIFDGAPHLQ